ncbi:uncharacterized protein [Taeniopygia guttata]|uniref:uncharacterized protein isoform X2 n=1 Tax=Taeniopygia guttata TaxID=59729 RepID=UPI003BB894F5
MAGVLLLQLGSDRPPSAQLHSPFSAASVTPMPQQLVRHLGSHNLCLGVHLLAGSEVHTMNVLLVPDSQGPEDTISDLLSTHSLC